MGSVNVNRSVSDVFYRYKMPRLMAKVEGKGNGIKTVIVNMAEVAKALGRPPTYPTKYFGCELGAQTQFDFKNERFIVNGSHDAGKLQDLLDGFIRKFVLCPECENPETELLVSTKRSTISQGCKACGYHGPLESNHKLVTFILKNPPNLNPAVQGSSLTEGKRSKRSKRANGDTNGDTSQVDDQNESLEASVNENSKNGDDDDAHEWQADVSEEAVRARMQDLTEGAKNMTINDDLEKSEKDRMDIFYELVKSKRDAGQLDNPQVYKELYNEADRLEIKTKAPLVLAEVLFDQNMKNQLSDYRLLLLRFCHDDKKAQRYLMGGFEQVIALHRDTLLNKVPVLLKTLYDLDVLSEATIIAWAEKVSKKYVSKEVSQEIHDKAAPFVKWLKEAETEESESEEESDDDVEIEYNDRAQVVPLKPTSTTNNKTERVEDDGEDDVDIDAI
ncbi:eukaryotic translation initiation factor 5 isoform X1 [Tribolium castaneum]|uniref:Eukaryotic translation initiation factor 5 n=1 Tax=Tribolium castaneum TaxID=7070 RepID=D2A3J2_TRICA|nr:eukaryotic translation initiation factor 5 [Tribolium castaneum]XP_008191995.1 PREDICTED: eukaryotic translation initiation factor 5 isoform X1 [Tribolium castaneum]XP_015834293.1 PREDICTED: eukaryotic translation initiation factor 5 isoform X1 [Tribolium castaneum]XP_015834294.1 PREDICTED: eukaryotic translation initiation factor 5 isoform X1 [Tribolium castaneum]EFA01900.1 Eukaryotic translation initiation factor 5-like Protein [Tribolium castaneum]|eukprot:NP_001107844.1 eukaryotic translation initiation factor 5 [Tribolium castaneum]